MNCPKCNSTHIQVTIEQTSSEIKNNNTGCLWSIGRWVLIICTGGLWLLVGKHQAKVRTKFKNKTVAICQDCAYKWYVK